MSRPQHTCRHFVRRSQLSQPVVSCGSNARRPRLPAYTNCHIRLTGICSFWTHMYMLELTSVISEVTVAETRSFLANVNSCSCSLYIVVRPSVVCLSVCRLSVTFVHPTQPIEIFGNVSAPFNTLVTWRHPGKILRRSSQGNPSVWGLNQRVVEKCSDFEPFARLYLGNGAR